MHLGGDQALRFEGKAATRETPLVKWSILGIALSFFAVFLLLPLLAVFVEALRKGWETYSAALTHPDAWSAIKLTLLAAAIALPLNLVFGVAAAWAIAKFEFRGKQILITLIDLPVLGLAGNCRAGLRAHFRGPGLVRRVAGRAGIHGHLRRAGDRAGNGVRDFPLHRP